MGSSARIPGSGSRAVAMAAAAHPWILAPWSCCCFPASATCSSPVLSPSFPPLLSTGTGSFNYPEYKSAFKAHQEIHQHQCAGMCLQWKYTLFQFGDTPVRILPLNSHAAITVFTQKLCLGMQHMEFPPWVTLIWNILLNQLFSYSSYPPAHHEVKGN